MTRHIYITALIFATLQVLSVSCAQENTETKEGTFMELPPPRMESDTSVETALEARRSVRSFVDTALPEETIAQLLWAAQGITAPRRGFRTAPSAGATYPLETYLLTEDGVFRYRPKEHALETVREKDQRRALAHAALNQMFVAEAPAVIVFTAVPERTTRRYGERGKMYIHMEAGHAAQNIHLQAIALDLGSVPVAAFEPGRVREILGAPDAENPLYIIPVGKPR